MCVCVPGPQCTGKWIQYKMTEKEVNIAYTLREQVYTLCCKELFLFGKVIKDQLRCPFCFQTFLDDKW